MSFRNPPTARTLGLTNKVSTFVGPDTDPPVADGLGDLWYVTNRGNVTRRWDGTQWVEFALSDAAIERITGSLVRTAESGTRWEMSSSFSNVLRGFTSRDTSVSVATGFDGVADFLSFAFSGVDEQVKLWGDGGPGSPPDFVYVANHLSRVGRHRFFGKMNVSHGLALGDDGSGNPLGQRLQGIDGGLDSGTTGPAGRRAITHLLSAVPDTVVVVPCNTGHVRVDDTTLTSNTFEVEFRDNANVTLGAGVARKTFWMALNFVGI